MKIIKLALNLLHFQQCLQLLIKLSYHINSFGSKVEALKIEVLSINTNDQLADQFTKGIQEGKSELAWKALMKC